MPFFQAEAETQPLRENSSLPGKEAAAEAILGNISLLSWGLFLEVSYPRHGPHSICSTPHLLSFLRANFLQLGTEYQAAKLCNMHHLLKSSAEKLKLKRFILNGDLTFYDEENIILSGVINSFCLKTEQFFEASMLCGIINEMRSLSSPGYCSSDVKVDS